MSTLGVVEIVDRAGHVRERVRVQQLPFRIGRALDNDLVLDDVYACAHHAEIRATDTLELIDLDSVNGSFVGTQAQRQSRIELGQHRELRLGHTHLRFRGIDEQLPATIPDPLAGSRWLGLDRWGWGLTATVGCALAMATDSILGSAQTLRLGAIASNVAPGLIVLALWALAWSLVNRVVAHRFQYFGHLALGGAAVVVANLMEVVGSYAIYATSLDDWLPAFGSISGALLVTALLFGHLRLISRGKSRSLLLPTSLVGLAFLTLSLLPGAGDDRFQSEPSIGGSLKPPFAALSEGSSSEAFYDSARDLMDEVDQDTEAAL
ncbi:MAG: FHA domain-containing protein [Xanthomonadales bacterium]|nr:FHA domain-containing protein [Xanthomonadales bacterium]MCP5475400.1 FHA domain-containing protein [Rhodanobacteraceae bacterium]